MSNKKGKKTRAEVAAAAASREMALVKEEEDEISDLERLSQQIQKVLQITILTQTDVKEIKLELTAVKQDLIQMKTQLCGFETRLQAQEMKLQTNEAAVHANLQKYKRLDQAVRRTNLKIIGMESIKESSQEGLMKLVHDFLFEVLKLPDDFSLELEHVQKIRMSRSAADSHMLIVKFLHINTRDQILQSFRISMQSPALNEKAKYPFSQTYSGTQQLNGELLTLLVKLPEL